MGGADRLQRRRDRGQLNARERIAGLIDPDSWRELGVLTRPEVERPGEWGAADGVVTGFARLGGRQIAVIAIDATVLAGTTAKVNGRKTHQLMADAAAAGMPIVSLVEADGGRVPEALGWRFAETRIAFREFLHPGNGAAGIPLRLCAAFGACYGDSALHAAASDITLMTNAASIALAGPEVVRSAIGLTTTHQELGGPKVAERNGLAQLVVEDEHEALRSIRRILSYLPSSTDHCAPRTQPRPPDRGVEEIHRVAALPARASYDVRELVAAIVDGDSMLELGHGRGRSLYTALCRLDGHTVGVVASQPKHQGGVLDVAALEKELWFLTLCDRFNVPVLLLHDVPGLMVGPNEEQRGMVRAFRDVLAKLSHLAVPRISVIMRKSYGGGFFVMGGAQAMPTRLIAWSSAEMGFMAPTTAATVVGVEAAQAVDRSPDSNSGRAWDVPSSAPWQAAERFYLHDVIAPEETREVVCDEIELAWGNRPRITEVR